MPVDIARDGDLAPLGSELDRVRDDVAQDLVKAFRVALDRRQVVRHRPRQRDLFALRQQAPGRPGPHRRVAASSTGRRSTPACPPMMRVTSRMSSISCVCSLAFRPMTSIAWRTRSAESMAPCCSIWTQPRIAFSGVRSSCESVPRNSSFSRLASSAAASRASSASLRRRDHHADAGHRAGRPCSYSTRPLPSHPADRAVGRHDPVFDLVRTPCSTARARRHAITRSRSSG